MKHSVMLTIASLLSILLMTFHLTDDVVRGMEPGGVKNLIGVLILALGVTATFSAILSARGLLSLKWGQSR